MNEYRYKKLPSLLDYRWTFISVSIAGFLSVAAIISFLDPEQRSESFIEAYGMYLVAMVSWWLPYFFFSIIRSKYHAAKDGTPALLVKADGIIVLSWHGNPVTMGWEEIKRLDLDENDNLMFASTKGFSGNIDLSELDSDPETIWTVIQTHRGRVLT